MLPTDKAAKIRTELTAVSRLRYVPEKRLERLRGTLQHAAIGIPAGKSLTAPITRQIKGKPTRRVTISQGLRNTLRDFRLLIDRTAKQPIHARQLVTTDADFIGYNDASGCCLGGVWLPGRCHIDPIVWQLDAPDDIIKRFKSWSNPNGDVTNNDLEMTAQLVQWLVLELLVNMKHTQAATWCDNSSTVSWSRRLSSTRSSIGHRLARALAIRQMETESRPLIVAPTPGVDNKMADEASRAAGKHKPPQMHSCPDLNFLSHFNKTFPLPQGKSWRMFRLSSVLRSRVFFELRNKRSTLASWQRITRKGNAVGSIGSDGQPSLKWTPVSVQAPDKNTSRPSAVLLTGLGEETTVVDELLKLRPFKSRFEPSARPSSWMSGTTRCTEQNNDT